MEWVTPPGDVYPLPKVVICPHCDTPIAAFPDLIKRAVIMHLELCTKANGL